MLSPLKYSTSKTLIYLYENLHTYGWLDSKLTASEVTSLVPIAELLPLLLDHTIYVGHMETE